MTAPVRLEAVSREPRAATPSRWLGLAGPALATVLALAILVGLGVWQLERKSWKEGLLAQMAARAYGPPAALPHEADWPAWRAASGEYARVRFTGTFLHDDEVPVHGLAEERPGQALQGFYVFTPLRLADGAVVIVNRGFVPTPLKDRASRPAAQADGLVTVTGLLRAPETRGAFVPASDPARNSWFVRSIDEMAAARSLGRVAPFYVDADATPNPGGWPRGGQTRLTLSNDHLQYAFTWFGLGAALLGVFTAYAVKRLRPAAPTGGDERQGAMADRPAPR